jgi:RimK family alpha-L-glutamate ligase
MNKKGWIIYSQKETLNSRFKNNAFDWMIEEAQKNNLDAIILFEENLEIRLKNEYYQFFSQEKELEKPDFVLLRTYCLNKAADLEKAGILVFNSSNSLFQCRDKWVSSQICLNNNIPMPHTILDQNQHFIDIESEIGTPFIAKEIIGSKGEQVYLVEDENQFYELKRKIDSSLLFQEFISESSGQDLRVHIIGNDAIIGIKRSSENNFKSNYSLGGKSELFELSKEAQELAINAAKAHGLDIAGVDLLFSNNGFMVCEVNGIAGFRTVAKDSDTNLPYLIFKHIAQSIYQ